MDRLLVQAAAKADLAAHRVAVDRTIRLVTEVPTEAVAATTARDQVMVPAVP